MHVASTMEIERKFLVNRLPDQLRECPFRSIEQGYLAVEDNGTEVRLRRQDDETFLTVKNGSGTTRDEREVRLEREQFDALWPLTRSRRVRKTRYEVPLGALTVEVDIYGGKNEGLIVAEVEFSGNEDCRNFQPPDWLGREISGEERYRNHNLASQE
jgi:adenylate cyclase